MFFLKISIYFLVVVEAFLLLINWFFIGVAILSPSLFSWVPRYHECIGTCMSIEPGGWLVYYMYSRDFLEKSINIFTSSFLLLLVGSFLCAVIGYSLSFVNKNNPAIKTERLNFAYVSLKLVGVSIFLLLTVDSLLDLQTGVCLYVLGCQY